MFSLGLDIGTTTITAVAFDPAALRLVSRVTLANDADCTPADKKALGWAELDLNRVFALTIAALTRVAQSLGPGASEVECVGVTGQMHGVAFLDHDAHSAPVRPAITWQDQRARVVIDEFISRAGGAGAFERMGCLPATGYLGPTLFWLKKHRSLEPHARACFIPDAIAAMLTGQPPISDATNAAASGVFDIVNREWSAEVLRRLDLSPTGLPPSRAGMDTLPPIAEAGAPVGALDATLAHQIGLPKGATVGVALGDHQASLIGSAADAPGAVHVNVGTSGQVSLVVDKFAPMDRAHGIETRPFPGNRYVLTGAALCGGDAFALLREFFAETASMLDLAPPGAPPGEQAMYAAMLSAASRISPGADGLRADTRFDGARHDPSARASFSNLSRANFTPAHLTRALLEGVAEELWAFYDAMREQAGAAHALIGSGNGIRRNPLLAEIISSRFGLPLRMPEWEEEAAVGAAIVAARTPSP